jgi:hypothetical protein
MALRLGLGDGGLVAVVTSLISVSRGLFLALEGARILGSLTL